MDTVIDPDKLHEAADQMLLLRNELNSVSSGIRLLYLSLGENWKGDAERAYESRLLFLLREYGNLLRFFEDYAALMHNCAAAYAAAENEILNKIRCI